MAVASGEKIKSLRLTHPSEPPVAKTSVPRKAASAKKGFVSTLPFENRVRFAACEQKDGFFCLWR